MSYSGRDARAQLRRWVDAGLLTEDQAAAIDAYETRRTSDRERPPQVSVAAEVFGYLGAVLLVVGIATAISASDLNLGTGGVLALLGLGVVAFGAGFVIVRRDEPVWQRLSSVLGFLSSASLGAFVGVFFADVLSTGAATTAMATGAAVLAQSIVFSLLCPRGLQQFAMFAAGMTVVLGALAQGCTLTTAIVGLTLLAAGTLWLTLTRAHLTRPRHVGYAMGAVATLVGAQLLSVDYRTLGTSLGVATAVMLLIWGAHSRIGTHMGTGAVGLLVFLPQFVNTLTGNPGGIALGLVAAGIVVLAVAVRMFRSREIR